MSKERSSEGRDWVVAFLRDHIFEQPEEGKYLWELYVGTLYLNSLYIWSGAPIKFLLPASVSPAEASQPTYNLMIEKTQEPKPVLTPAPATLQAA